MPYTVPKQKIIHINREAVTDNFLQIKKENWYNANKDLEPYGLQLYLYLAGNKDGFDLALSQKAAEEAGIRSTTFHKYVNDVAKGLIAMGITREQRIAIKAANTPQWIAIEMAA